MTHRERRDMERAAGVASHDPRAILLAATPPSQRSEVAAKYDHAIEERELDANSEPKTEELEYLQLQLWRGSVAIHLAENAGYRDVVSRYLGGHRTSPGMDRAVCEAEAATPMPNADEVRAAWQQDRTTRRNYLRLRYGV